MTAGSIRWGVLSTAKIAREKVAPAIHAAHNGILHAVASRDVGRAQAFARDLEIPTAYGSYDELLADDAIDAVYIPLPTSFHHRWVIKAAEAGKHILCDKPFASDARQAEQMVAACTAASVQLIEGFMYRYDPRHQRVRELLAAGAIGDLRRVRVVFSFLIAPGPANVRLSAELDGGVWGDLGCYCVSISRLYMQQEPTWIQASLEYDDELGVDIDGSAIMGFGPQRRALVDFSFITGAQQCLEVAGTEGRISCHSASSRWRGRGSFASSVAATKRKRSKSCLPSPSIRTWPKLRIWARPSAAKPSRAFPAARRYATCASSTPCAPAPVAAVGFPSHETRR